MKNFYSFKEIKSRLTCEEYLRSRGIEVRDGRCVAEWRGGTHLSVALDGETWFDHVQKVGGSVIQLCALVECGNIGAAMRASEILGDRLGLDPVRRLKSARLTRSEHLLATGYAQKAVYDYRNENGVLVYQVVRFEKPASECKEGEKPKEFIHCTPDHEGLDKDTPKLLYNLPSVIKSQEVFVVEGEKDCDTLTALGLCATTNSGGARNFDPSLVGYLKNKDVIILPDNDDAGEGHVRLLVSLIHPIAKSLKLVRLSALPKGDVTDWMNEENGTIQKLRDLVNSAEPAVPDLSPEVAAAKEANKTPLSNYVEEWVERTGDNGKKKSVRVTHPVPISALIRELKVRFLDFPRRLGDTLFDYTQGAERQILKLFNKDALFGWVQGTSGQPVMWATGEGLVTKGELFERLIQCSTRYDAITNAPFYPPRPDVFFTHGRLPPPDPTHSAFWTIVDRFCLATPADKTLLAAWLLTPMFYKADAPKPMFIIDTVDAQGSGKTTVAKLCAYLYGTPAVILNFSDLEKRAAEVKKDLISSVGRSKRIILFDNVTGTLKNNFLSELVTTGHITERAAYGRDLETRVNDLSLIATVNGSIVDTDMSVRCYTLRVRKPECYDSSWELTTMRLMDEHRLQLFSDMLHMMATAPKRARTDSRFAGYDETVLSAACRSDAEFAAADALIHSQRESSNEDSELIEEFRMLIERVVAGNDAIGDITIPLFFLASDIDALLKSAGGALGRLTARKVGVLVRQTFGHPFDRKFKQIPPNGQGIPRLTGVLFNPYGRDAVVNGRMLYQVVKRDEHDNFVPCESPIARTVSDADAMTMFRMGDGAAGTEGQADGEDGADGAKEDIPF